MRSPRWSPGPVRMRHATPLDVGNGVACGDRGGGDGGGDGEGGMTTRNRLT